MPKSLRAFRAAAARLAAACALVPALPMPGATPLWGSGAAIFLALTLAVRRAERRTRT